MRGLDLIGEWWRLEISSRKLFNAIYALPDKSAFKTAVREHDWTPDEYIWGRIANEIMMLRADHAAAHDSKMKPSLLESPRQIAEREEARAEQRGLHEFLMKQMRGEISLPARERGPMVVDEEKGGAAK